MSKSRRDLLTLACAVVVVFAVAAIIGLQFLPEPRSRAEYMVVGTMATLFALGTLFLGLIATIYRGTNPFFKNRATVEETKSDDPTE